MACKKIVTLLGYEDEPVTEKNKTLANFATNKVGGRPDITTENSQIDAPNCPLCQLPRVLVVQVYAPIENLTYHRTLYVFACVNPNCWNQNESWTCLRGQSLDAANQDLCTTTETNASNTSKQFAKNTDWCADADDWDDDNSNFEENGNVVNKSDDEDESASFDDSIRVGFEQLGVDDNDKNANACLAEAQGGAVGTIQSPTASAEIEGAEGEAVCIDTPTYPQRDIAAILTEAAHLPQDIFQSKAPPQFEAFFMSVYEEQEPQRNFVDRHVRELLQEYQANNDDINFAGGGAKMPADSGDLTLEKYEKTNPAHGDKMFHYFLTKIKENPGQLLRYCRGANGLLLYPLQESPRKCRHCQSDVVFEFQLLPTLIPLLRLRGDKSDATRLEFGNVLVFTCSKSCWFNDGTLRQEYVVVQSEKI